MRGTLAAGLVGLTFAALAAGISFFVQIQTSGFDRESCGVFKEQGKRIPGCVFW